MVSLLSYFIYKKSQEKFSQIRSKERVFNIKTTVTTKDTSSINKIEKNDNNNSNIYKSNINNNVKI